MNLTWRDSRCYATINTLRGQISLASRRALVERGPGRQLESRVRGCARVSGWCGDVGGGSYPMYNRLLTAGEINTVINNIRWPGRCKKRPLLLAGQHKKRFGRFQSSYPSDSRSVTSCSDSFPAAGNARGKGNPWPRLNVNSSTPAYR